ATFGTCSLTPFKPVISTAPTEARLVVGFHTSGLFSSLSRLAGAAAGAAAADFAGAALVSAGDELDGLLPPDSAHATRNASSTKKYCFISTPIEVVRAHASSESRPASSIIRAAHSITLCPA